MLDTLQHQSTPLHFAAEHSNKVEELKVLIDAGAPVNAVDEVRDSVYCVMVMYCVIIVAKWLIIILLNQNKLVCQ